MYVLCVSYVKVCMSMCMHVRACVCVCVATSLCSCVCLCVVSCPSVTAVELFGRKAVSEGSPVPSPGTAHCTHS